MLSDVEVDRPAGHAEMACAGLGEARTRTNIVYAIYAGPVLCCHCILLESWPFCASSVEDEGREEDIDRIDFNSKSSLRVIRGDQDSFDSLIW